MIAINISKKRPIYLTIYDVHKSYDNADNEDLLVTMLEKGLKGKTWRILKELNSNLKVEIKTRFGKTREIEKEIGGIQDS